MEKKEFERRLGVGKSKSQSSIIGWVVVAVLLFFVSMTCWKTVPAGSIGLKDVFGKVSTHIYSSGLVIKEPWAKIRIFDLKTQRITLDNVQGADKDGQLVTADIILNFRIANKNAAREILINVGDERSYQSVLALEQKAAEGFKQSSVTMEALEMLERRNDLKELSEENILNLYPTDYLAIESITVTDIRYSAEFDAAIEKKKTAVQLALAAENEVKVAEAEAKKSIAQAEGDKQVTILNAEAEAESLRIQKEAVSKAPELLELRRIERDKLAIQKWDGSLPQWITSGGEMPFISVGSVGG